MALISFPLNSDSVTSRTFSEGPSQEYDPPGYDGFKRELSYTVPQNKKALISVTFGFTISGQSASTPDVIIQKNISFTDFLKAGDILYFGVRTYANATNYAYEMFYQVNSISLFSETLSPTAHGKSTPIAHSLSCYSLVLELDK